LQNKANPTVTSLSIHILNKVFPSCDSLCSLRDLIETQNKVLYDDEGEFICRLSYQKWLTIVKQECGFDLSCHYLTYKLNQADTVTVSSEYTWRAALHQIHSQHKDLFRFTMVQASNWGGLTSDGCLNCETCQGDAYNNTSQEKISEGTSGHKWHAGQDLELLCLQVLAPKQAQVQEDLKGTDNNSASYISGDSAADNSDMKPEDLDIHQQCNDNILLQDRLSSVDVSQPSNNSPICSGSTGPWCVTTNNCNTDESSPIGPSEISSSWDTHSEPLQNLDREARTISVITVIDDQCLQPSLTSSTYIYPPRTSLTEMHLIPIQQTEQDICTDSE